jgi:hypothetical protein
VQPTENFRRQHDALLTLSKEIGAHLADVDGVRANAVAVRKLMARFSGQLGVHATMENDALYPRLLAHDDDAVRARARAFLDEFGGIYAEYGVYAQRWLSADAIAARPADFVKETRDMFRLLARRMVRENIELYPLVDALG